MFINTGARDLLLRGERQKFLAEEWPRVSATIQRLGLTPEELLDAAATRRSSLDEAASDAAESDAAESNAAGSEAAKKEPKS